MSDFKPGVQITDEGIEIFEGDARSQLISHGYITQDGERGLAYANLVLLHALVERQSAIAAALNQLAMAIGSARKNSQETIDATMDAAMGKAFAQLAKLGLKMPASQG